MTDKEFVQAVQARKAELSAKIDKSELSETELGALEAKLTSKAKGDVKQAERDSALALLVKFANDVGASDPEIVAAAKLLTKAPRVAGTTTNKAPSAPRASRFTALDDMFPEVGTEVHEDAVFSKFKFGRKDMYWIIADAIKGAKDKSLRKWVSFDPTSGVYRFEAQQSAPPADWTGYVPLDERVKAE